MDWLALDSQQLAIGALIASVLLATVLVFWARVHQEVRRLRSERTDAEDSARALEANLKDQSDKLTAARQEIARLREEAESLRDQTRNAKAVLVEQTDRLQQLIDSKSRFMVGISTQLRTPLTLAISPLEDVLERCGDTLQSDMKADLQLALRNARRLMLIVGQIQDISKLDTGQMSIKPIRVDVRHELSDLSLSFAPWAERKKIQFHLEIPETEVWLHIDPDVLKKALVNLTTASFKVTPPGGAIRITLKPPQWLSVRGDQASFVSVSVRDTGPGIPADQSPHLFDRFYQVATSERTELSVALELPLAKELIELHGGYVDVASEVGFGTEVTAFLRTGDSHLDAAKFPPEPSTDLVPTPEFAVPYAEGAEDSAPELSRTEGDDVTTVLIVEDNDDVRTLLRRILEPGLRVVEARDGKEGLQAARDTTPDLVISDVIMPGMDGFELCQRLKSDPDMAFIPVILLTAKADVEDRIEGLKEGADDYIIKPFNRDELRARVENLIARRKRIKDRFSRQMELHASDIDVVSMDDNFIRNARKVIEMHIDDEDFSVEEFADAMGMSRGHLHRRLKALLNVSPSEAVRKIRLERAQQLLVGRAGTVSEIAYQVGFRSVSHFCRCFKEAYGRTPAEVASAANG